ALRPRMPVEGRSHRLPPPGRCGNAASWQERSPARLRIGIPAVDVEADDRAGRPPRLRQVLRQEQGLTEGRDASAKPLDGRCGRPWRARWLWLQRVRKRRRLARVE